MWLSERHALLAKRWLGVYGSGSPNSKACSVGAALRIVGIAIQDCRYSCLYTPVNIPFTLHMFFSHSSAMIETRKTLPDEG
jgi:hypothetical protein